MVNIQELVNQRNPVSVYSPTRVLTRQRANAGTARQVLASRTMGGGGASAPSGPAPRFQLGPTQPVQTPNLAVPTGAPGRSINDMVSHARAGTAQAGGGGGGGFLGSVVNSLPGKAIMGALNVLDVPRRAVVSTVQETADIFNGGDASWDDFVSQVGDSNFGFGDVIGSTGNLWLDRGIGFVGDVLLDPMTYVGGAGLVSGTGRRSRLGLAARAIESGVDEDIARRLGRYGINGITDAEREIVRRASAESGGLITEGAEKILDRGYYFHAPFSDVQRRLPFSGRVDEVLGGTASRIRATIADTPFARSLRNRNVDEALVEAQERLLTGRGSLSLAEAAEVYNKAQADKIGSRMAKRTAEGHLVQMMKTHTPAALNSMVRLAETEGGTPINAFFAKMAKMLNDMGISHGMIQKYVPHYYTEGGMAWLGKSDPKALAFAKVFGAGNSLDDFSPSLMKRHFVARPEPYDINGFKFTLKTGSIDEINSEFQRLTGSKIKLLEDDFQKIASRYMATVGDDIGNMTGIQRLLKSRSGLVRRGDDHEALRALVDEDATKIANEAKMTELRDSLDSVKRNVEQMRVDAASGVRALSSGVLGARLRDMVDDLTSLTDGQRQLLTDAIMADGKLSEIRGIPTYGGAHAAGQGTLNDALERVYRETDEKFQALALERGKLERAAFLEQQQLLGELSKMTPTAAFAMEAPQRFGQLQRYRQLTQQSLELQRDRAAIAAAHEIMQTSAIRVAQADRLAASNSFLTQFLPESVRAQLAGDPGVAERAAADMARAQAERQATGKERLYDRPHMSRESILGRSNAARASVIAPDPARNPEAVAKLAAYNPNPSDAYRDLANQARATNDLIVAKSGEVIRLRHNVENLASSQTPMITAAQIHLQSMKTELARYDLKMEELKGVPGRKEERLQIAVDRTNFRHGQLGAAQDAYDRSRVELDEARRAYEEANDSLSKLQAKQVSIAREMDERAYLDNRIARIEAAGAVPEVQAQQVPLPLTATEEAAARTRHAELSREQQQYQRSTTGKRERRAAAESERVSAELAAVRAEKAQMIDGRSDYMFDADGNVQFRSATTRADYKLLIDRDDASRLARQLESEARVSQSDLRAIDDKMERGLVTASEAKEMKRQAFAADDAAFGKWWKAQQDLNALNRKIAGIQRKRHVPSLELSRRRMDRLYDLAEQEVELAGRQARLANISDRIGYRGRDLRANLTQVEERLGEQTAAKTRNAAEVARARGVNQAARNAPFERQNFLESSLRAINAREAHEMNHAAGFVGYKLQFDDVADVDPEAAGVRALTPSERLDYEEAQAIIRERDSFPRGNDNPTVQKARRTVKQLRAQVGDDMLVEGQRTFDDLQSALDDIAMARTSWQPKSGTPEHAALTAPIRRRKSVGGDTSVVGRSKLTHRLAQYMRKTHMPRLVESGAIPNEAMARHITDKIESLSTMLDQYANNPAMFMVRHLEQTQADVNRWLDFMVRYTRALEAGVEPNDQVATFIATRSLQLESDTLGAEIKQLQERVAPKQGRIRPAQRAAAEELGESLSERGRELVARGRLTTEQVEEFEYHLKIGRLEAQIEADRALVKTIDDEQLAGKLTPERKTERTRARTRVTKNTRRRARIYAPNYGPMKEVFESVVNTVSDQIDILDSKVTDFNDIRHSFHDAKWIGQQAQQTQANITTLEGRLNDYSSSQRRLVAAIARAERNGTDVVRYRPAVEEDFFFTVDQARAALAAGEVPLYIRPKIEAEIARVEGRYARAELGEVTEELRASAAQRWKRGQGLDPEVIEFARERDLAAYEEFRREPPEGYERRPPAPTPPSTLAKYRGKRGQAMAAFAREHGISQSEVIHSSALRTADPSGMSVMTMDEAIRLRDGNAQALSEHADTLEGYRINQRVISGEIHNDISASQAIIQDASDPQPPSSQELMRSAEEIQRRAEATGRDMTPDEKSQVHVLTERARALRKGKMSPEQLSEVQTKLDRYESQLAKFKFVMGDHYDQVRAAIDGGDRFFADLMNGRRTPTTRDIEVMRSLMGGEQGEAAAMMVTKFNELLGIEHIPTRSDLNLMGQRFGVPPITGPSRSLVLGNYEPSMEDLRALRTDIEQLPDVLLADAKAVANRDAWIKGLTQLIEPPALEPRALSRGEVSDIFTEMGMYFGETRVVDEMMRSVQGALEAGEIVYDDALRDQMRMALVNAAQVNYRDELTETLNMVAGLGMSFPVATPGFNGKLQALGYTMGNQQWDAPTLRKFVAGRMQSMGLTVEGHMSDRLNQLVMRKNRIDTMRVGLGATVRSFDWSGGDPRQLFELLGHAGGDELRQIDAELAQFSRLVKPYEANTIVDSRIAHLNADLAEARAAGDTAKMSAIFDRISELDGRRLSPPQEIDAGGVGDLPTTTVPDPAYEQQIATAEQASSAAHTALDSAKARLAHVEANPTAGPGDAAALYVRHPDTPAGKYSLGEIYAMQDQLMDRIHNAPNEEAAKEALRDQQRIMRNLWADEPQESKDAVLRAAQGEVNTTELDNARTAVETAEAESRRLDGELTSLRNNGPAEVIQPPSEIDPSATRLAEGDDPDAEMTFDQADAAYNEALGELEQARNYGDASEEVVQYTAKVAARVRKLAEVRNNKALEHSTELLAQRAAVAGQAISRQAREGRQVTWDWAEVMTRGVPSQNYVRRGQGAGRAGNVVADVSGMAGQPAGRFARSSLPHQEQLVRQAMEPATSARDELLAARVAAQQARNEAENTLDHFAGRNLDVEIEATQREAAGVKEYLATEPGEARREEIRGQLAEGVVDLERQRIATDLQRDQVRAERAAAERSYTDALADVDEQLHDVRQTIANLETTVPAAEARIARIEATINYQGVSSQDLQYHVEDLRTLNDQRAAAGADPELLADIAHVEGLLEAAAQATSKLSYAELGQSIIEKRLKEFETGAASVAEVMKYQIADGWRPIAEHLMPPLESGVPAVLMANGLYTGIRNMDAAMRKGESWGLIDQYTKFFKTYATATPGFHVRNLLSGIFMNMVDGVKLRHMRRAMPIWRDFMRDPFGYLDTAPPEVRRALMVVFGSGASGQWMEVGGAAATDTLSRKGWSRLMNNKLTRWNQRAGSSVEGTVRLGMALDSMSRGQNIAAALERVTKYHFDYSEMSKLDRNARKLIPFWTFISRNLPLQIESMWLRPRTYLQYQSFVRNFGEVADPLTPQYWLDQGAFTMAGDAADQERPWFLAPDLPHLRVAEPIAALANLDLGKAILSDINPLIAAPVEAFGVGKKFYTGQDIEEEYNEPSAPMRMLMPLLALLQGTEEGGTSGDLLLDDRYAHVARTLLPTLNLAERLLDNEGNRAGRQGETIYRALGAPVLRLTPELREQTQRSAYFDRRAAAERAAALARS